MKKLTTMGTIVLVAFGLAFTSCKKKDSDENDDDTSLQTEQSADESLMQNESETSLNEADIALAGSTFGKTGGIAGATINDSSFIAQKKLVITYNGNSADGKRNRTGEVVVQLISGNNWGEAGAVVKIDFNNLHITHIASGKSITINGNHIVTNINGGRAFVNTSVVHSIRGSMSVTFDNTSTTRSWQIARKRTIASAAGAYTITVSGDTTLNSIPKIIVWGTNRAGNSFYTQINQDVVWSSLCPTGPSSGVKVHKGIAREITVTFGVDASGNPVTGGNCPYGLKINWKNIRNVDKTALISY
jgi:hypothetical protein